jgi:hypothetical protein
VNAAEQHGKGVAMFRNHNKMDVVRHEAVGEQTYPGIVEVFAQEVQVGAMIGRRMKVSWLRERKILRDFVEREGSVRTFTLKGSAPKPV